MISSFWPQQTETQEHNLGVHEQEGVTPPPPPGTLISLEEILTNLDTPNEILTAIKLIDNDDMGNSNFLNNNVTAQLELLRSAIRLVSLKISGGEEGGSGAEFHGGTGAEFESGVGAENVGESGIGAEFHGGVGGEITPLLDGRSVLNVLMNRKRILQSYETIEMWSEQQQQEEGREAEVEGGDIKPLSQEDRGWMQVFGTDLWPQLIQNFQNSETKSQIPTRLSNFQTSQFLACFQWTTTEIIGNSNSHIGFEKSDLAKFLWGPVLVGGSEGSELTERALALLQLPSHNVLDLFLTWILATPLPSLLSLRSSTLLSFFMQYLTTSATTEKNPEFPHDSENSEIPYFLVVFDFVEKCESVWHGLLICALVRTCLAKNKASDPLHMQTIGRLYAQLQTILFLQTHLKSDFAQKGMCLKKLNSELPPFALLAHELLFLLSEELHKTDTSSPQQEGGEEAQEMSFGDILERLTPEKFEQFFHKMPENVEICIRHLTSKETCPLPGSILRPHISTCSNAHVLYHLATLTQPTLSFSISTLCHLSQIFESTNGSLAVLYAVLLHRIFETHVGPRVFCELERGGSVEGLDAGRFLRDHPMRLQESELTTFLSVFCPLLLRTLCSAISTHEKQVRENAEKKAAKKAQKVLPLASEFSFISTDPIFAPAFKSFSEWTKKDKILSNIDELVSFFKFLSIAFEWSKLSKLPNFDFDDLFSVLDVFRPPPPEESGGSNIATEVPSSLLSTSAQRRQDFCNSFLHTFWPIVSAASSPLSKQTNQLRLQRAVFELNEIFKLSPEISKLQISELWLKECIGTSDMCALDLIQGVSDRCKAGELLLNVCRQRAAAFLSILQKGKKIPIGSRSVVFSDVVAHLTPELMDWIMGAPDADQVPMAAFSDPLFISNLRTVLNKIVDCLKTNPKCTEAKLCSQLIVFAECVSK